MHLCFLICCSLQFAGDVFIQVSWISGGTMYFFPAIYQCHHLLVIRIAEARRLWLAVFSHRSCSHVDCLCDKCSQSMPIAWINLYLFQRSFNGRFQCESQGSGSANTESMYALALKRRWISANHMLFMADQLMQKTCIHMCVSGGQPAV